MRKIVPAALILTTFGSVTVHGTPTDFKLNGFMAAGVAWTNVDYRPAGVEPIYVSRIGKQPSFEKDSNVGLQISKHLNDEVSATVQLFAEGSSDFDVEATWAFIKYEPSDNFQFRAGRVQSNIFMLSEYVNVAYAYPWVRPPQEVYTQNPFNYYTGFDGRIQINICDRDLSFSAFWGSTSEELNAPIAFNSSLLDTIDVDLRHLWSLNLKFGDEFFSVRAGYETSYITLHPNAGTFAQGLNNFVDTMIGLGFLGTDYVDYFSANNDRISFMGVGYQFDWNNIVSMGEWVRRRSTSPLIANPIGWYLMGGYRVKELLPHITYAREKIADNYVRHFNSTVNTAAALPPPLGFGVPLDNIAQVLVGSNYYNSAGAGNQTSVTLGIRWDIIDGIALKAEYCHVHPDKLSPGLFDVNTFKSVNVYSFAVDAVF